MELTISSGRLRGTDDGVFRGIPYAEPPVGALRLRAPVPARRWDGVRDALAFGPPPPQSAPWGSETAEDTGWLTLTVWTPDPGARGLPVLVWIHGGAYVLGHCGDPLFDAAALARTGLVVVAPNYRLGAEGFVEAEGAPSNRGLLDQLLALRWVQDNIAAFGGDPGNVTVAGESAGGASVAALVAAAPARGLFRRAIAASPPAGFQTKGLAMGLGRALRDRITSGRLADVPPDRLAEAYSEFSAELPKLPEGWGLAGRLAALGPVVDGELVEDVPWRSLADGRAGDVDLLVTHTRDEARLFISINAQLDVGPQDLVTLAPAAVADGYRRTWPDAAPDQLYETLYSDVLIRMPAAHLAEAHAETGGRTFAGEVTVESPTLGACHGIDVPLLFGTYETPQARMLLGTPSDEIRAAGDALRRAWTEFARCGDPGWPEFTGRGGPTRLLGTGDPVVVPYPEERSRALWSVDDLGPFDSNR
ncbi:para-nitrobenzyl esterase [Cryptosporangium aurantiacum]|uniref:Carboxylic ester hydrolase n=1 Tax=Cryptosporangium aurantiacum TaxID=134849 RepID=A0A1M7P7V1_9ACTN|nr:para-nitrobenzyl esterase [Cryptosporangium aurantiacum]